ncbi:hypothetical protein N431DRAFT_144457 [Stipitochalara longipes BDJ]|nr:hypothetical protein N431DRAFT_144457 [Stipitochalara longipes BDJ]
MRSSVLNMDPLSLAASIIAVATAAAQISQAISRLRTFSEIPGRVYALKNEVTDFEVVLRQIGYALQQQSLAPDTNRGSLKEILVRTKMHLTNLAQALERVENSCSRGNVKIISRSAIWCKEKVLFDGFQNDLHAAKSSLHLLLGASNS